MPFLAEFPVTVVWKSRLRSRFPVKLGLSKDEPTDLTLTVALTLNLKLCTLCATDCVDHRSCKHPPSIVCVASFSYLFAWHLPWPFINLNVSLMLACLLLLFRDTWLDNRTIFFGVLANYLLRKCKCNIFLIPNKLTTTNVKLT